MATSPRPTRPAGSGDVNALETISSINNTTSDGMADGNPRPDEQLSKPAEQQIAAKQPKQRSSTVIALIMASLCMAVFLAALDSVVVATALPAISRDLGASDSGFAWIPSSYLLASAASIPVWGRLADIFGRKPAIIVANVIFSIASLISALAVNLSMLIAGRVIQGMSFAYKHTPPSAGSADDNTGIGSGGILVLVNVIVADLFSLRYLVTLFVLDEILMHVTYRDRGKYMGIIAGIWAVATASGPLIGGAFSEYVTWRWIFWGKHFSSRSYSVLTTSS